MKYGSNPSPKCPPPNIPGRQPTKGLTVSVDVTGIDKFKELAGLISDMLKDERISNEVKQEYINRLESIRANKKSIDTR